MKYGWLVLAVISALWWGGSAVVPAQLGTVALAQSGESNAVEYFTPSNARWRARQRKKGGLNANVDRRLRQRGDRLPFWQRIFGRRPARNENVGNLGWRGNGFSRRNPPQRPNPRPSLVPDGVDRVTTQMERESNRRPNNPGLGWSGNNYSPRSAPNGGRNWSLPFPDFLNRLQVQRQRYEDRPVSPSYGWQGNRFSPRSSPTAPRSWNLQPPDWLNDRQVARQRYEDRPYSPSYGWQGNQRSAGSPTESNGGNLGWSGSLRSNGQPNRGNGAGLGWEGDLFGPRKRATPPRQLGIEPPDWLNDRLVDMERRSNMPRSEAYGWQGNQSVQPGRNYGNGAGLGWAGNLRTNGQPNRGNGAGLGWEGDLFGPRKRPTPPRQLNLEPPDWLNDKLVAMERRSNMPRSEAYGWQGNLNVRPGRNYGNGEGLGWQGNLRVSRQPDYQVAGLGWQGDMFSPRKRPEPPMELNIELPDFINDWWVKKLRYENMPESPAYGWEGNLRAAKNWEDRYLNRTYRDIAKFAPIRAPRTVDMYTLNQVETYRGFEQRMRTPLGDAIHYSRTSYQSGHYREWNKHLIRRRNGWKGHPTENHRYSAAMTSREEVEFLRQLNLRYNRIFSYNQQPDVFKKKARRPGYDKGEAEYWRDLQERSRMDNSREPAPDTDD